MKLPKNKKGSELVEKIMVAAFAVAAGGAVIVYTGNVVISAKNTQITGILGGAGQTQLTQEQLDAHFNDSAKAITFTAQELNTLPFTNLSSHFTQVIPDSEVIPLFSSSVSYGGSTWTFDEIIPGEYIGYWLDSYTSGYLYFGWQEQTNQTGIILTEYAGEVNHTSIRNPIQFQGNLVWNIGNADDYNLYKELVISDLS